jgi:predicted PurR-regulated permease PerM
VELRVPFRTLLKIALFVLACMIVMRLRQVLILVIVASLLAIALDPLKERLERHMKRGFAIAIIALLLFSLVALVLAVVIPQTIAESAQLAKKLPEIAKRAHQVWPAGAPYVESLASEFAKPPQPGQVKQWLPKGKLAVGAIAAVFFALVLVLYLLIDGRRMIAWLVTYAPHEQREKLVQTIDDVRPLIFGYVKGQFITSTLSFIAAISVLVPLKVPAAFPLAVLAFFGDFVPVAGFLVALAPAVLLAATVSPSAALIVAAVYVGYQALENYVIAPRVYGKRLDLSPLAVVLAIAVGGALMGPIGAILMLPLVAAWPAIEKIWFADRLPPDTIEKHDEISENGVERVDEVLE